MSCVGRVEGRDSRAASEDQERWSVLSTAAGGGADSPEKTRTQVTHTDRRTDRQCLTVYVSVKISM